MKKNGYRIMFCSPTDGMRPGIRYQSAGGCTLRQDVARGAYRSVEKCFYGYAEKLLATGKPVVLVVFVGRAQIISNIAKRCAAVIQAWYPGEEGGHAVADILYGKVSPEVHTAGLLSLLLQPKQGYHAIIVFHLTTMLK